MEAKQPKGRGGGRRPPDRAGAFATTIGGYWPVYKSPARWRALWARLQGYPDQAIGAALERLFMNQGSRAAPQPEQIVRAVREELHEVSSREAALRTLRRFERQNPIPEIEWEPVGFELAGEPVGRRAWALGEHALSTVGVADNPRIAIAYADLSDAQLREVIGLARASRPPEDSMTLAEWLDLVCADRVADMTPERVARVVPSLRGPIERRLGRRLAIPETKAGDEVDRAVAGLLGKQRR